MTKMSAIIKSKILRLAIVFVLLLLLVTLPLLPGLYHQSRTTVTVTSEGGMFNPTHNNPITQEIFIEGRISNLTIPMIVSGENALDGNVYVTVVQDGITLSEVTPASHIRSERNMYHTGLTLSELQRGSAVITVWSSGLSEGTQIYVLTSQTVLSGLPAAIGNGNALYGPMVLSYNVFRFNMYFYYNTILFTLLVLTIAATAYLLTYKEKLLEKRNILFLCSFAAIFLHISIINPTAGLLGEPISEAAYEFWYKAHELGFFQSLMTLMSGYALSWLERILIWTADLLSPSNRNVFFIAQVMVLSFISLVVSIPCLKGFNKYFSNEARFVFCFVVGALLVDAPIYWFFTTSYWGIFFFIGFAFMNMREMKAPIYYAGLVLAVILCFSRIYYAPLIPISLFLAIAVGKQLGKRFRIYCYTVFLAATLNGVYSARFAGADMADANFMGNLSYIGPVQILVNTIYYQIQVIQSIFFGPIIQHFNGIASNAFFLMLLVAVVVYCLIIFIYRKEERVFASAMLSLIAISMGTIMITVITSGSWGAIAFQKDYSEVVSWRQYHYQNANQHFIISYTAVMFAFLTFAYHIKVKAAPYAIAIHDLFKKRNKQFEKFSFMPIKIGTILFMIVLMFIGSLPHHRLIPTYHVPTQWRSVYHVTHREFTYYLPVNRTWPFEWIGLWHHSQALTFAYFPGPNENNNFTVANPGGPPFITNVPFHTAVLGDISNIEDRYVLSLGVRRGIVNFDTIMYAVFFDREGHEISRIRQAEAPDRLWLTFLFEEAGRPFGHPNIYSVSFYLEGGHPAMVVGALQFGVSMFVPVGR
jgi:hypothetical protein